MRRIEVDGLDLELDEEALADIEVADMLYELASGEAVPPVKKLIVACFGKTQYKAICEALKDESGHVSIVAATEFFARALTAANEKK